MERISCTPRENYREIVEKQGFGFHESYWMEDACYCFTSAEIEALEKAPAGETYHISEPAAYSQKDFRKLVMRLLGKRFVLPVRLPLWAVKAVCAVSEKIGVLRM